MEVFDLFELYFLVAPPPILLNDVVQGRLPWQCA